MATDPEIIDRLARIETKLDAVSRTLPDHEKRIRANEHSRFRILSIASAIAFVGGLISNYIGKAISA